MKRKRKIPLWETPPPPPMTDEELQELFDEPDDGISFGGFDISEEPVEDE